MPSAGDDASNTNWLIAGKGAMIRNSPSAWAKLSIAGSPAPPKIAQQIYGQAILSKMCLRYSQGGPMEKTLAGRKAVR